MILFTSEARSFPSGGGYLSIKTEFSGGRLTDAFGARVYSGLRELSSTF
jgi:hypothetical protein